MIYTVTLNPSVDVLVRLDHLAIGQVNRVSSDKKYVGGKGINVSRVLNRLGLSNIATGFIGGFTGEFIEASLSLEGIKTDFIRVEEDTRINVKVKDDAETEINGAGPYISEEQLIELKEILAQLSSDDTVVFAGSAPKNLGNEIYNELILIVKTVGAQIVCDFEGQTLLDSLSYEPLLIKPNKHELEAIFNVSLTNLTEVETYGRQLLELGAKNVIVSMSSEGAILLTNETTYFAKAIEGQVKNSVGAGDSMIAGFLHEWSLSSNLVEAFKWGVACGTATAFSEDLATDKVIKEMYEKVEIEVL